VTPLATIALYGCIPAILVLFAIVPPRTAVAVAFIGGILLLPMYELEVKFVPQFNKITATSIGVMIGIGVFDAGRFVAYRFRVIDLPIIAWCISPFFASITNDLGAYDGVSASLMSVLMYGVPYFVGRLYFSDPDGLEFLLKSIVVGGLIYVPLCLYEVRMSPQLHRVLYGEHAHSFAQTYRFGGYRPTVFMQHGLMVGMWMTAATLAGFGLALHARAKRLLGAPMWVWVCVLGLTAVLCKSLGALGLLAVGVSLICAVRLTKAPALVWCMALVVPAYLVARVALNWDAGTIVELASRIDKDRADSLGVRLFNENLLVERALERPMFGWGGWNRARLEDEDTITDSLWIIAIGQRGLVGLVACFAYMVIPAMLVCTRRTMADQRVAVPLLALSIILLMYAIDCLLNAMVVPAYSIVAGAAAGAAGVAAASTRKHGAAPLRRPRTMANPTSTHA
jgi:hypothetical protein